MAGRGTLGGGGIGGASPDRSVGTLIPMEFPSLCPGRPARQDPPGCGTMAHRLKGRPDTPGGTRGATPEAGGPDTGAGWNWC